MRKILIVLVSLYLITCLGVYLSQDYILFQRGTLPSDYEYEIDEAYVEVVLGPEKKHHAVHIRKTGAEGIIVYFHGNRDSLKRWIRLTRNLSKYNYDLLLVEYPEYGKSKAELSQSALEKLGGLSYEYAREHYASDKVIIYGRSMGTGLATYVAGKESCKAVILETPYYSLNELLSRYLFLLPREWLINYAFNNFENLQKTSAPIYLLHGTEDQIIPIGMATKLARQLSDKAELTIINGGRHHDLSDYQEYWDTLDAIFLN